MTPDRFPNAPSRIARLLTDRRGFPIPWFVSWKDASPQFPVLDASKLTIAWRDEKCWVCGDKLGGYRAWVVGPMSVVEGAAPEPPSHPECAAFSVTSCPHLATPQARRSERHLDHPEYQERSNISKVRTGAAAIWVTKGRGATPFPAGGGVLFGLEEPHSLEWFTAGRPATSGEVRAAIAIGLPTLLRAAQEEQRAAELNRRLELLERWIPRD